MRRFDLIPLALLLGWPLGCRTVPQVERWQDPSPPRLALFEKADRYQKELEAHFQTPEGLLRYRRDLTPPPDPPPGDFADGAFHTGAYLASQALRFAVTGLPEARAQVEKTLGAATLLLEVSGKRGLLARHFSPVDPRLPHWMRSPRHPGYWFREDVSKDQYAGWIHGLGVALALMPGQEVRSRVAALASAAADHLEENGLRIIGLDGCETKHGDLRGRILCFPIGVNAAIALAVAKVAAESTGEERYRRFYRELVERGYPRMIHWTHPPLLDTGKRVNENMTYLALYVLVLLEKDRRVLEDLRQAEERLWRWVRDERNAYFSFVHGALQGAPLTYLARDCSEGAAGDGCQKGRQALLEYPDDKVEWPVDLTRPGLGFSRAFTLFPWSEPYASRSVPLYLRPRSSSFWSSNPYRLTGNLGSRGDAETAGMDYLLAYWMGRFHRWVNPLE